MNHILFFMNHCVSLLVLRWKSLARQHIFSVNSRHVLISKHRRNPAAFRLFVFIREI